MLPYEVCNLLQIANLSTKAKKTSRIKSNSTKELRQLDFILNNKTIGGLHGKTALGELRPFSLVASSTFSQLLHITLLLSDVFYLY